MAKYLTECKKAQEAIDSAFPEGLTTDQVEAIHRCLRATVTVRNHATMDNAVKALFPKAKFGISRVHSEFRQRDYEILYCKEGYELEPVENPFEGVEDGGISDEGLVEVAAETIEHSEPRSPNPFR